MQRLHFSIQIRAPRTKVWDTMLQDKTYRLWAAVFMPGSHFVGSWDEGSRIQFLGPDDDGKMSGMTSEIVENRSHTFVSIKHLGLVKDGVEDTTSEEVKQWVGLENYTFRDEDATTIVLVDIDTNDGFLDYTKEAWPKALQKLKEIAEEKG